MTEAWEKRLREAIQDALDSGRSMRDISLAAKVGPNYVSQFMEKGSKPSVDKFLKLARELDVSPIYIIAGFHMTRQTQELVEVFEELSPERRESLLRFVAPEEESGHIEEPSPSLHPKE